MTEPETRIYLVAHTSGKEYLVEAKSRAAALQHIAARTLTCELAPQKKLVDLVRAGMLPELAGTAGPDQQDLPLDTGTTPGTDATTNEA